MSIRLRSNLVRAGVLVISVSGALSLAYLIAKQAYVDWLFSQGTKESLQKVLELDPNSCRAYSRLGLYYVYSLEGMGQGRAEEFSRRAVRCQPLESSFWINLAMALQTAGKTEESSAATETAASLETHNSWVLWRCANLFLVNGKTDEALDMFYRVLKGAPEYALQTFSICWKATNDGSLILSRVVPDNADLNLAYLNFLANPNYLDLNALRNKWISLTGLDEGDLPRNATFGQLDRLIKTKTREATSEEKGKGFLLTASERREAQEQRLNHAAHVVAEWNRYVTEQWEPRINVAALVWDRLLSSAQGFTPDHVNLTFPYLDALLRVGRPAQAVRAWNQLVLLGILPNAEGHSATNLIVNGGFEVNPVNGGLDWRMAPVGGVSVGLDKTVHHSGDSSLAVHFEGLNNRDFHHVFQLVPVTPDTHYRFTAFMKTRALNSGSGPHFEIADSTDPDRNTWQTKDVLGTTEWAEFTLDILTGPDTEVLRVTLRRTPGVGLSNRPEGTVWVDDVKLESEDVGPARPLE